MNVTNIELIEAIRTRHSVRKYLVRPIEAEKTAALRSLIDEANVESGLHIQLVLDELRAFSSGILKYGAFSGVKNYLVMAGRKGKDMEEQIGYQGERIVLLAQSLGLNTCWVGLTYKKIPEAFTLAEGEAVHCVIALGYGEDPGIQHPLKPLEKFVEVDGEMPAWFQAGMEAVLLAPTALNQQKFKFFLREGNRVEAKALFAFNGYAAIDLGIAKCHFEIGAGEADFSWV